MQRLLLVLALFAGLIGAVGTASAAVSAFGCDYDDPAAMSGHAEFDGATSSSTLSAEGCGESPVSRSPQAGDAPTTLRSTFVAPQPTLFSSGGARTNADMLANGGGLPRNLDTVQSYAQQAGVGLDGVNVRLLNGADDIRYLDANNAVAFASDRTIYLGPGAFADEATLVRTLGHERTHIYQQQIWRPGTGNIGDLEDAAHGIEDSFWQYYQSGGQP